MEDPYITVELKPGPGPALPTVSTGSASKFNAKRMFRLQKRGKSDKAVESIVTMDQAQRATSVPAPRGV